MKLSFYPFIFLILIAACQSGEKSNKDLRLEKPNVIIIFPDQLRRYSAGFWSDSLYAQHVQGKPDPVATPNIDKLARNGVVFTKAVSNFPLCSPSRGMLLSGMYPEQNGIWGNCKVGRDHSLRDSIETITDLFYKAGYNTSYFGKCHWHRNDPLFSKNGDYVGSPESPGGFYLNTYDTYIPPGKSRHNIEYFYQSIRDTHFDPLVFSNDANAIGGKSDGELYTPRVFSPKNESAQIISYIKNERAQRDTDKPFFMIWSINPPHNPWDDKNTDMTFLESHYDSDKYPSIDSLLVRENADKDVGTYVRHYFANVTSTDHYIGNVLDELESNHMLDNTIVLFSADHGEMLGSHGRQGKNIHFTESLGVPFIVHWPEQIKSGISDIIISVPDILPTLMGLAQLEQLIPATVQGTNYANQLTAPSEDFEKPDAALYMVGNARGVVTDRYTLSIVENKAALKQDAKVDSIKEAFIIDNELDPYQLTKIDLEDQPALSNILLKQLGELLKKTNDPWYQKRKYADMIHYPAIAN